MRLKRFLRLSIRVNIVFAFLKKVDACPLLDRDMNLHVILFEIKSS